MGVVSAPCSWLKMMPTDAKILAQIRQIPVIALSNACPDEDRMVCFGLGAHNYSSRHYKPGIDRCPPRYGRPTEFLLSFVDRTTNLSFT